MSNEKEINNCSPKAYGISLNLRSLSLIKTMSKKLDKTFLS